LGRARARRGDARMMTWRRPPSISRPASSSRSSSPGIQRAAPGARFHPRDAAAQETQDRAPTGAGGPGAPDPPPHAPQLALGNVLASVAGLPGSSIKLLESEIPVRSVPPSHVLGTATRGFPTPHQLAHHVWVFAVQLRDPQVVVRTERSRHRLREIQVPVLNRSWAETSAHRAIQRQRVAVTSGTTHGRF